MPFNFSALTVSAAIDQIADSIGATGDSEQRTRALNSLKATVAHWNGRANWDFMLVEGDPIALVGPFTVTGITASAGQTSALCPASHGFLVDDLISMPGVILGGRVSATAAGSIGLSVTLSASIGTGNQVVTATAVRDMYALPSAWKAPYGARLLSAGRTLRFYRSRMANRAIADQTTPASPVGYDIFTVPSKGKLRLRQPPSAPDVLLPQYYRRITMPSAANDGRSFDVPEDYEAYLIAYAKAHMLTDRAEGRGEQKATWFAFAKEGIAVMLADQTRVQDEELSFVPGHYAGSNSPDSTTNIEWDR